MKTLRKEQVLKLHDSLLEAFGGTAGVRDDGLLDSALSAPFATFVGQYLSVCAGKSCTAWIRSCL